MSSDLKESHHSSLPELPQFSDEEKEALRGLTSSYTKKKWKELVELYVDYKRGGYDDEVYQDALYYGHGPAVPIEDKLRDLAVEIDDNLYNDFEEHVHGDASDEKLIDKLGDFCEKLWKHLDGVENLSESFDKFRYEPKTRAAIPTGETSGSESVLNQYEDIISDLEEFLADTISFNRLDLGTQYEIDKRKESPDKTFKSKYKKPEKVAADDYRAELQWLIDSELYKLTSPDFRGRKDTFARRDITPRELQSFAG